jgi:hypothetical protein
MDWMIRAAQAQQTSKSIEQAQIFLQQYQNKQQEKDENV